MSSGWPPEDDDRRWEPARHPSAVGAVHDSRDAERGYSGYAHSGPEGRYAEEQYAEGHYEPAQYGREQDAGGQYADGENGGWYGVPDGGYQQPHYQPEPDNAGYGQVSYPDVYDLGAAPGGGFPAQAGYPGQGYVEHPSFPNLPAQPQAYGAPVAADYEQGGYPAQYTGQQYTGQQYTEEQYTGQQHAEPQDFGYQDYGDPRYNDPSFGDPAYEDTPHAGYRTPAPSYYDYPPSYGADTGPGYPRQEHPASGQQYAAPSQDYALPESPPDSTAGYVAAEYASGQFPAGVGALGELTAGQPDPAATGMVDASGMLDATGISDHAELYNYHPGAGAEAGQAFAGAPAPIGTLDASGLPPAPDDTIIDGHAPILGPAEAADHAGVLDGGTASAYLDPASFGAQAAPAVAAPAGTAAPEFGTEAAPDRPAFTGTAAAEITSLDLPPADSFDRGPASGTSRTGGTGALLRPRSTRPAGKRRGASGDRRLWIALGGVLVVAAVAITAIVMVAFPSGPGGPAHTVVTPDQVGAFVRRPALEQQMNVSQLRQDVVNMSSGQARHVVEGVYESGTSASASTQQIILFIGGNLANASPADSVASFTKRFKGATVAGAGALGGKAVCVNATAAEPGGVAMCAWFDNDSFGEVVSPTMDASALAGAMRQIRPKVELIAPGKS